MLEFFRIFFVPFFISHNQGISAGGDWLRQCRRRSLSPNLYQNFLQENLVSAQA
jgi:hypothetical protein